MQDNGIGKDSGGTDKEEICSTWNSEIRTFTQTISASADTRLDLSHSDRSPPVEPWNI